MLQFWGVSQGHSPTIVQAQVGSRPFDTVILIMLQFWGVSQGHSPTIVQAQVGSRPFDTVILICYSHNIYIFTYTFINK